jgi:hypothetical protein
MTGKFKPKPQPVAIYRKELFDTEGNESGGGVAWDLPPHPTTKSKQ